MALDHFGRQLHYLRISLTDHCNLRCLYCMPEEVVFQPSAELMQDDEVITLVKVFTGLGFDKIRLTGGEPTIRYHVVDLVQQIASTPGVDTLTMTTNGVLLSRMAHPLAQAGLQRVNISLDTLDPDKFQTLTRWGSLEDVWSGIHAAEAAGLTPIKINAVVVRDYNEADMTDLARLTLEHPWQIRFIEMMPFGAKQRFPDISIGDCHRDAPYHRINIGSAGASQWWRSGWRSPHLPLARSSGRYRFYLFGQFAVLPFMHAGAPDCRWALALVPSQGR